MLCIHRKIALILIIAFIIYFLYKNKNLDNDEYFEDVDSDLKTNNSVVISSADGSLLTTSNLRIDNTGKNISIKDTKGNKNLLSINSDGKITLYGDIQIQGSLTVDKEVNINGKLFANKGSQFKGGKHTFREVENKGDLILGHVGDLPGVYRDQNNPFMIGEWETGTMELGGDFTSLMKPDKKTTYWKSNRPSNAIINSKGSGISNMQWSGDINYLVEVQEGNRKNTAILGGSVSKLT